MPVTIAPIEIDTKPKTTDGGIGGGPGRGDWGGDRPDGWGNSSPQHFQDHLQSYRLGMLLGLASILMLFVALSSAYVMRQGGSLDWHPIALPPLLLPNTFLLLLSSMTFELARKAAKGHFDNAFRRWMSLTTLLGVLFVLGQVVIWRSLAAQGIYLGSNPHSSFFYLLTGAHGVHLLGGIVALGYVTFRAWFSRGWVLAGRTAVDVTALYWHFMDGLWIYLFLLLFVWR
jgi:cytochrome c oxidase subunit 3